MRRKRERDPLHAARKRLEAAENASFLDHLEENADIAILLARENDTRLDAAIARGGRAAVETEWKECKRRIVFAQFFASRAFAHVRCKAGPCRRARRCAYGGLSCLRGLILSRGEETAARGRFNDFIRFMSAPEGESEQAVRGKA